MSDDAECFDKLVQMRGDLRWNPLMDKWVCYPFQYTDQPSGGVFASDPNPNEAVAKAHRMWLAHEQEKAVS